MRSIRIILILLAGIAHNAHAVLDTIDVSQTRPALLWYANENHQTMYYFQNDYHQWNVCTDNLYPSNTASLKHGYTYDLQGVYDLQEIVVSIPTKSTYDGVISFDVYIDGSICKKRSFKSQKSTNISIILDCINSRGRIVTVTSNDAQICSAQILACGSGVMGENCDKHCWHRYGISCSLPCQCRGNITCDRHTGYCTNGCYNSDGHRYVDCHLKSLEKISGQTFIDFSKEKRSLVTSLHNLENTKSCKTVKFSKTRNGYIFWIEWKFSLPKMLRAIEFYSNNFPSEEPAVFGVTVDDKVCVVDTLRYNSTSRIYKCNKSNFQGKSIQLIVRANKDILDTRNRPPEICDVKLLTCHPGYYGPFCRLPCNCQLLPCHPETGFCKDYRCIPGHKGSNCAQVDLTKTDDVFVTEGQGTIENIPALFPDGPIPFSMNTSNNDSLWMVSRSFLLSGTFMVNHLTVTIGPSATKSVRNISAYTDTKPVDSPVYDKAKPPMTGLPCVESYRIATTPDLHLDVDPDLTPMTMLLECPGPATVVTVVVLMTSDLDTSVIEDVGIWTCMGGTFGHRCRMMCNCMRPGEVCNQITGRCVSKCPPTHRGANCHEEICHPNHCKLSCSETGECTTKCLPGWMGADCSIGCPDGFFGDGCMKTCHGCRVYPNMKTCDPKNGTCFSGCKDGYDNYRSDCDVLQATQYVKAPMVPVGYTAHQYNIAFYLVSVCIPCATVILVAMCAHKRMHAGEPVPSQVDSANCGPRALPFKNIYEGWMWLESKKMRGFETACEYCSTSDLTHFQKVAIWILCQNFDEAIKRRLEKLQKVAPDKSISDTPISQVSTQLEDMEDLNEIP